MIFMYQKTVEYHLHEFFERDKHLYRKKGKKKIQKILEQKNFYAIQLIQVLGQYPHLILPDRDEAVAFGQTFFENYLKLTRKKSIFKAPSDEIIEILADEQVRTVIEVLTMLKYKPVQISALLRENYLIEVSDGTIDEYLTYFWNYMRIQASYLNIFFSKTLDDSDYYLHNAVFTRSLPQQAILSLLGIKVEIKNIIESIKQNMITIGVLLSEAIAKKEVVTAQRLSNMLKSLAEVNLKLGGEMDTKEFLNDYIDVIYTDDEEEPVTWEQLQKENEELERKQNMLKNTERTNL